MSVSASRRIAEFTSLDARSRAVSISLVVIIVIDVIAVVFDYLQIQLLTRVQAGELITEAEAMANDSRQAMIGIIYVIMFIVTAVLFCVWIHRAHKNLPSLGAEGLKYSPGWAVGGFFVPILNLFRPYQVTREIWKASDPSVDVNDGLAWQNTDASPIIILWWIMFLVSGFIGYFLMRASLTAETIGELLTVSKLTLATDIVDIPAAFLAILVVRTIGHRQKQKSQRLLSVGTLR